MYLIVEEVYYCGVLDVCVVYSDLILKCLKFENEFVEYFVNYELKLYDVEVRMDYVKCGVVNLVFISEDLDLMDGIDS